VPDLGHMSAIVELTGCYPLPEAKTLGERLAHQRTTLACCDYSCGASSKPPSL
jgi:hypothetical protein